MTAPSQQLIDHRIASCMHLADLVGLRYHQRWEWPASVDGDDLKQIARLELWQLAAKAPADMPGSFEALVTSAMKRRIIDERRKLLGKEGKRVGVVCTRELNLEVHDQPDQQRSSFETVDLVRQTLDGAKLTDRERRYIQLVGEDWLSGEIAADMGVAHTYIAKIKESLRRKLAAIGR